ncbi:amino acid ABC transporter substrate-binding protein, PAAT family [Enhydrobacter aerosaccus]|uniref:Amino acid ABC transporter substrate-binding protein, PAAT family n=2 Tax=Enhydrobacter aerosaccus TaxID=225324 RepID=A0A1T4P0N5_9HYPH|nr:amino acid ABC transporter substrate-binding protein, PAAT family [Enhydrobacter aerosaccus]
MMSALRVRVGIVAGAILLASVSGALAQGSPTIEAIRARGELICGVAGTSPLFSFPDSQGVMRGLDADSCRAVAAAILGDAQKVKFVPATPESRFPLLQSGQVDMLYRSTTWSLGREANLGAMFASVNFYDGTGFLVKATLGVKSAKDIDGAAVCISPGGGTELVVEDFFRSNKMKYTPILIKDLQEVQRAYLSGRCDVYASDMSALAGFRYQQGDKASDHILLSETISKEPLGAMVRKGDDKFFDAVRWTFFAQVAAEEQGITAANVDDALKSQVPEVRRLMGLEGDLGKALGLDNKWAFNVIKQVGNYGEMWDRDITPYGVPRGINKLWKAGGLQFAPPIR